MEIFRESNKYSCFYDLFKKRTFACLRIVKPAVGSLLEHGCKDGKFGLEPILFEGQMSSDFCSISYDLFRSIWHRFDFPFGLYSLDISFRLRSTESFYSRQITKLMCLFWTEFVLHRTLSLPCIRPLSQCDYTQDRYRRWRCVSTQEFFF
jgi:hypothetical protein